MKLKFENKEELIPGVYSFNFTPEQKFNFIPGQFLHYTLKHPQPDARKTDRYFTISAAPQEDYITFTTRIIPSGSSFKQALMDLQAGSEIEAEGPEGDFTYPSPEVEAVFIAGGIGITPYRSILVDQDRKDNNPQVTLLYANRSGQIPFKRLFGSLAQKHNNLKVVYTIDQPEKGWRGEVGKINEEFIKKYVSDLQKPIFYVSGPEPMVEALGGMLKELGVAEDKIKQDFFPGYEEI